MKNEEKLRIYYIFNQNAGKITETVKKEILNYLFGYKEIDTIL